MSNCLLGKLLAVLRRQDADVKNDAKDVRMRVFKLLRRRWHVKTERFSLYLTKNVNQTTRIA